MKLTIVGSGLSTGKYTGVLTARTGRPQGPLRTALSADIKPKPSTVPPPVGPGGPRLRVTALDRTGRSVQISVSLDKLKDGQPGLPTRIEPGQSAFIPAGEYGVTGLIQSPDGSSTVATATVQLASNTDLVLDAREAKPIRVAVGEPDARPVSTRITIDQETKERLFWVDMSKPLYVIPSRGRKYRFDSVWARNGMVAGSPYLYQLADLDDGGVPEHPKVQVDDSTLDRSSRPIEPTTAVRATSRFVPCPQHQGHRPSRGVRTCT